MAVLYRVLALAVAIKYLRLGVREAPLGSNTGFYVSRFLSAIGLGPNPWCCAFVVNNFQEAGLTIYRTGLVQALWNWGEAKGYTFRRGTQLPAPGDLICFEWDGSLGSGDRVSQRVYRLSDPKIYGYIRIPGEKVSPHDPGAPYVTKPYPLPELIRVAGGRAKVKLGKKILKEGPLKEVRAFYLEKKKYWTDRNLKRR